MHSSIRSSNSGNLITKRPTLNKATLSNSIRNNRLANPTRNHNRKVSGIRDAGIPTQRSSARSLKPTSHAIP